MPRKESALTAIGAQLDRLACREVMLVDVTAYEEACFERGLDVIWCNATTALRSLTDLPDRCGDDATWIALRQRGRPGGGL
jgi:hypothetical protein